MNIVEIKDLLNSEERWQLDAGDWMAYVEEMVEEIERLTADRDSETRWAAHYHSRLADLQEAGLLPDGFEY